MPNSRCLTGAVPYESARVREFLSTSQRLATRLLVQLHCAGSATWAKAKAGQRALVNGSGGGMLGPGPLDSRHVSASALGFRSDDRCSRLVEGARLVR
jgi:hypothetical protein